MEQIKVCFLMTIYNTPETYLRQAIESILNQTVPEWVLVLRDNGSDDGKTAEILREYAQKDARIFYCRNEVNWLPTREEHIEWRTLAQRYLLSGATEYFAFLDSDDAYTPDFLEVTYREAQKYNAEMVICGTTMVEEGNEKASEKRIPPALFLEEKKLTSEQFYQLYGSVRTLWGKLYKTALFREYANAFQTMRAVRVHNSGDTYVMLQLLCKVNRLVCLGQSLHIYRIRRASVYRSVPVSVLFSRVSDGERLFLRACLTAKAYGCLTQKTVNFLYLVYEYHIRDALSLVIQNEGMTPEDKLVYFHVVMNAPIFKQIGESSNQMRLMFGQQLRQLVSSGISIPAEQYPQLLELLESE